MAIFKLTSPFDINVLTRSLVLIAKDSFVSLVTNLSNRNNVVKNVSKNGWSCLSRQKPPNIFFSKINPLNTDRVNADNRLFFIPRGTNSHVSLTSLVICSLSIFLVTIIY